MGRGWRPPSPLLLALLLVAGCLLLPSLWILVQRQAQQFRTDQQLTAMLSSLREADAANQQVLRHVDLESERGVQLHFPWLLQPQHNALPNFFLASGADPEDRTRHHRDAAIVLLHQPLDLLGGAVTACFRSLASGRGLSVAPPMSFATRRLLDSGNFTGSVLKFKDRFAVHHGRYTWGVCSRLDTPCAYVAVLREPFRAAASSFRYCRERPQDRALCGGLDASRLSLRQWILRQGSPLFSHLTASLQHCGPGRNGTGEATRPAGPSQQQQQQQKQEGQEEEEELLCREFHRLTLESHSDVTVTQAVNFVVGRLRSWFRVLGLAEEMPATLQLLQHLYRLPLQSCLERVQEAEEEAGGGGADRGLRDNSGHSQAGLRRGEGEGEGEGRDWWGDQDDLRALVNDVQVRQALEPDLRIYREARRLFAIQRQTLTNRVA